MMSYKLQCELARALYDVIKYILPEIIIEWQNGMIVVEFFCPLMCAFGFSFRYFKKKNKRKENEKKININNKNEINPHDCH